VRGLIIAFRSDRGSAAGSTLNAKAQATLGEGAITLVERKILRGAIPRVRQGE